MPKTAYIAIDGKVFEEHSEARTHERLLFVNWLLTKPQIDISQLITEADDEDKEEQCGTERDMVVSIAKIAFERSYD